MHPKLVLLSLLSPALALPFETWNQGQKYAVQSCARTSEATYFSCENPNKVANDSCCYENYGVIMQTQFWDYNSTYLEWAKSGNTSVVSSSSAPNDDYDVSKLFTIHGLWDDLCDGSYDQFCQPDLEFTDADNITDILVNQYHQKQMYETMLKVWVNNEGGDEGSISLWEHEFNKHGTCFNTLRPKCFKGKYTRFENAVAYFQKTLEVWSNLQTYNILEAAWIVPSTSFQYLLADVQAALAAGHEGKSVYVGCTLGAISEIWYYHEVKGNVLNGQYKPIASMSKTNCPEEVWYIPK